MTGSVIAIETKKDPKTYQAGDKIISLSLTELRKYLLKMEGLPIKQKAITIMELTYGLFPPSMLSVNIPASRFHISGIYLALPNLKKAQQPC
ncbi:hypothetical protein J2S17_000073 [Cytobacillus purgationiresistens]|uniref:Uncharacterized protein n=1 Tax=Cytobacillus purgationiresistens TaxID=863449 RepID=A0ABU0ABF0_9BACI|nr:hypothetical protein [Cytobacillus purgationiresistens]